MNFEVFTVKIQVVVFWAVIPWRWKQHRPLEQWYPTITVNNIITQKTIMWNNLACQWNWTVTRNTKSCWNM